MYVSSCFLLLLLLLYLHFYSTQTILSSTISTYISYNLTPSLEIFIHSFFLSSESIQNKNLQNLNYIQNNLDVINHLQFKKIIFLIYTNFKWGKTRNRLPETSFFVHKTICLQYCRAIRVSFFVSNPNTIYESNVYTFINSQFFYARKKWKYYLL